MNREAATWRNPNDLAIRLTAGWYARYERAGVLESTCCVAVSRSTKKSSMNSTRYLMIRILKLYTMDAMPASSGLQ